MKETKSYALTLPQFIAWNAEQLSANKSLVNLCGMMKLPGTIQFPVMNKAVNLTVAQHDGLRLRMMEQNGDVRQHVTAYQEKAIDFLDFSKPGGQADLHVWRRETAGKPFELLNSDLFYFALLKLDDAEFGLFFKLHHLIADDWSITVILNQIMRNYHDLQQGIPVETGLISSFENYLISLEKASGLNLLKLVAKFFMDKFTSRPAAIQIKPHQESDDHTAARRTFTAPFEFEREVKNYALEKHTTVFQIFLAGLSLLLSLKNQAEDTGIGALFHGRMTPEHMETAGMFVKFVPFRIRVDRSNSVDAFMKRIALLWLANIKNQPPQLNLAELTEIFEKVDYLFDVLLSYQSNLPDLTVETFHEDMEIQPISLMIYILDSPSGGMKLEFTYRTAWFTGREVEIIYQQLMDLITAMIRNPMRQLGTFSMDHRDE